MIDTQKSPASGGGFLLLFGYRLFLVCINELMQSKGILMCRRIRLGLLEGKMILKSDKIRMMRRIMLAMN